MVGLILIELISLVSFIFSILIFIFTKTTINNFMVVFLWMILVSYFLVNLKKKDKRYLYTGILMFLPIIKYHSISDIFFLTISVLYICYYIFNYFGEVGFKFIKEGFLKRLISYVIVICMDFIFNISRGMSNKYIIFMIVYFISTIVLLRSLRHLEYDSDIKKINRTNFLYAINVILISSIFGSNSFRQIIKSVYNFIIDLIFKILYWPIVFFGFLIEKLFKLLMKLIHKNAEDISFEKIIIGFENELEFTQKESKSLFWIKSIVAVIFGVILILILVRIAKKLFEKKVFTRRKTETAYIEEREFISLDDNKKKRKIMLFRPRSLEEQIRYYYKKYLIKAKKRGVSIELSDTSQDVNIKANEIFEESITEDLRDIYIKNRYGEKGTDKIEVDKMKNLYKKL